MTLEHIKTVLVWGILVLLCVVALIWYFQPPPRPEPVGMSLKEQQDLTDQVAVLRRENTSLTKELQEVTRKDSAQAEGFKRAIATLQKENRRLSVNPKVIEVRTSVPEVDSLLALKDVIITRQADRIAEMEHTATTLVGINERIQGNFENQLSKTQELLADQTTKNNELTKENRKLRRRLVFTKIGAVVGVVAAVIIAL